MVDENVACQIWLFFAVNGRSAAQLQFECVCLALGSDGTRVVC
jgi:hypothetical protein